MAQVQRNHYGLYVEDTVLVEPAGHALKISTMKRAGGAVETIVTRVKLDPNGLGFSFVMFEDFNRSYASYRGMRATEKNLLTVHAEVMAKLDAIKADCDAHYKALAEKRGVNA